MQNFCSHGTYLEVNPSYVSYLFKNLPPFSACFQVSEIVSPSLVLPEPSYEFSASVRPEPLFSVHVPFSPPPGGCHTTIGPPQSLCYTSWLQSGLLLYSHPNYVYSTPHICSVSPSKAWTNRPIIIPASVRIPFPPQCCPPSLLTPNKCCPTFAAYLL